MDKRDHDLRGPALRMVPLTGVKVRAADDDTGRKHVGGYASIFDHVYKVNEWFGSYNEVIDAGAFATTLAADPDVVLRANHVGLGMARTHNPKGSTLTLGADDTGFHFDGLVNPSRLDVADMMLAINDGDVTEASFAFTIVRGQWSPDWEEYRILEVDLERGDVAVVTYGANDATSVTVRARAVALRQQRVLRANVDPYAAPASTDLLAVPVLGRRVASIVDDFDLHMRGD